MVEFSSGENGPIPTNESYLYGLEATPMLLCVLLLALFHPGRFLVGPDSEFSKLRVEKGARRWWCCGLRKRTKVDPDFEMSDEASGEADPLKERRRRGSRRESRRESRRAEADMRQVRRESEV